MPVSYGLSREQLEDANFRLKGYDHAAWNKDMAKVRNLFLSQDLSFASNVPPASIWENVDERDTALLASTKSTVHIQSSEKTPTSCHHDVRAALG